MVVSTTLFMLRDTPLSREIRARRLTKFDAASYLKNNEPAYENLFPYSNTPIWDYVNRREQYRHVAAPVELLTAFTNYSIISKIP